MKKIIIPLLASMFLCCTKTNTNTDTDSIRVVLIDDKTDPFELRPIPEPILAIFKFETNNGREAFYRHVFITDKKLNPTQEFHLPSGIETEKRNINEEMDYRDRLISSFYDQIRHDINTSEKKFSNRDTLKYSECFATISAELERLASSEATQRTTLIVFSDLQENNEFFSCYTRDGQRLLQTNPQKVAELLQKQHMLPSSLVGINVYFVYLPLTREEDRRFNQMVTIYKQLLEERGAKVVIQANNKYYEP